MSKIIYTCTLPFPLSVNQLFGGGSGQKRFTSKKYKAWKEAASHVLIPPLVPLIGPLRIDYLFYFPDKRKRDLSNYIKAPEDLLVSSGVMEDDNFFIVVENRLISKGIDRDNPRVTIKIRNKV